MNDKHVREQLTNALAERQAHMLFEDAVKDFPSEHYNTRPTNTTYSFWHLIEHIRITQWDILDYIENPNYQYREFPAGYWPPSDADTDEQGWHKTIEQFNHDLDALIQIVNNPDTDLYAQIPHAQAGHTILREINIVATHNAYHVGELGILRAVMGLWETQNLK